jgi:hypothetical protein
MKKLLYAQGQGSIDQVKAVQELPADIQRFKFFAKDVVKHLHKNKFYTSTARVNDDNSITYANNTHTLMMNNTSGKIFTVQSLAGGMHITPDGVTMWKGFSLQGVPTEAMEAIVNEIGCEWLLANCVSEYSTKEYRLLSLLTPASFTRVIKGKLTNPKQLMKHYLTYSGKYRHLKLARYTNMLLDIYVNSVSESYFSYLLDACATDVNPERLIQYAHNNDGKLPDTWRNYSQQCDITKECHQLNVKIDHMWSVNRLNEEHTKLSRLVREKHIMFMDLIEYPYLSTCPLMPGMELITDNKRLWTEGSTLDHCIYSYLDSAMNRDLFHFHCTFGDKSFSLAIMQKYDGTRYIVQQMHGLRNSRCSDTQRNIVEQWLAEDAVQQWFKHEKLVSGVKHIDNFELPPYLGPDDIAQLDVLPF